MKAYRDLQQRMRLLEGQYSGDNYELCDNEIRLIAINMERLRWVESTSGVIIYIDLPEYTLRFQQPDSTYTFKIAIGDKTHPTPELYSKIAYLTTAPDVAITQ